MWNVTVHYIHFIIRITLTLARTGISQIIKTSRSIIHSKIYLSIYKMTSSTQLAHEFFDQVYIRDLNLRLVTHNLVLKYLQIFPLFGPGTWLSLTQISPDRQDQFIAKTRLITDDDLVYVPYRALHSYGFDQEGIDRIRSRANDQTLLITHAALQAERDISERTTVSCNIALYYTTSFFNMSWQRSYHY
jgi:hypothetical protein